MRMVTILVLSTTVFFTYVADGIEIQSTRNQLNGRLDVLNAILNASDFNLGKDLTEEVQNHVRKFSAPDDAIGVLLDQKLGGPGNETYNALPMNPTTREMWKTKVINPTQNFLMANKSRAVYFLVTPFYENENSMRPYGFGIFISEFNTNTNAQIVKGYIPNPPKSISQSIVPYVYSTGRVWTENRRNATYDFVRIETDQPLRERVEMVLKFVRLSDLSTGTDLDETTRNRTRMMGGTESDVPGLLINQKIGGKGDDPYNAVPMSFKAVQELKTRVEDPTLEFFANPSNKDKSVVIAMMLVYPDNTSSRPAGFCVFSRQFSMYRLFISNQ